MADAESNVEYRASPCWADAGYQSLSAEAAGAVLVEAHDEWQVSNRRYLPEGSMALLNRPADPTKQVVQPAPIAS